MSCRFNLRGLESGEGYRWLIYGPVRFPGPRSLSSSPSTEMKPRGLQLLMKGPAIFQRLLSSARLSMAWSTISVTPPDLRLSILTSIQPEYLASNTSTLVDDCRNLDERSLVTELGSVSAFSSPLRHRGAYHGRVVFVPISIQSQASPPGHPLCYPPQPLPYPIIATSASIPHIEATTANSMRTCRCYGGYSF